MANSLYTNPIYLDATAASSRTGDMVLMSVAWVSDAGAGDDIAANDDFLLSDSMGNKIIGKRAEVDGDDLYISWPMGLPVKGTTLTTLDGGVVYIYVK